MQRPGVTLRGASGFARNDSDSTVSPTVIEVCDAASVDADRNASANNDHLDATGRVPLFVDAHGANFGSGAPSWSADKRPRQLTLQQ